VGLAKEGKAKKQKKTRKRATQNAIHESLKNLKKEANRRWQRPSHTQTTLTKTGLA